MCRIGLALFGLYVLAQLPFNTPQKAPSRGGGGTLEFSGSKEPSVAQGQEKPLPVRGKPYDKYQQEIDQAWLNQHRGIKAGCNRFNPTYPNGKPVSDSDRQRFTQIQKRGQDDLAYRQSIGDREETKAGIEAVEKLRAEGVPLGLHQPGKAKAKTRWNGGDTSRLAKFEPTLAGVDLQAKEHPDWLIDHEPDGTQRPIRSTGGGYTFYWTKEEFQKNEERIVAEGAEQDVYLAKRKASEATKAAWLKEFRK